ncbi:MAG: clp protease binding subunit, partial [Candidatus Saccharibacteria bacterium]|nr:clp protease binding subunit [Candidatus Saccharibacteria bacterium]
MGARFMDVIFQYHQERASKARIGRVLAGVTGKLLTISTVVFAICGVIFVLVGLPLGWAVLGLAAIPAICMEWYRGELKKLPISKKPQNLTDVLAGNVLAQLN